MAIEINERWAQLLAERHPEVEVVRADARILPELLAERGITAVDGVVSGLPWVGYAPGPDGRGLHSVLTDVLADTGVFTQIGYALTRYAPPARRNLAELGLGRCRLAPPGRAAQDFPHSHTPPDTCVTATSRVRRAELMYQRPHVSPHARGVPGRQLVTPLEVLSEREAERVEQLSRRQLRHRVLARPVGSTGVRAAPTEVLETLTPLVHVRREIRTDSGGAGRWRGGLGQVVEVRRRGDHAWTVNANIDRVLHEAPGACGGLPGARGAFVDAHSGDELPRKQLVRLGPDKEVRLCFPGGGGYGRPTDRSIDAVLSDVVNGYITLEAARTTYGVVIDYLGRDDALVRPPGTYRVDLERTAALRARMTERRD